MATHISRYNIQNEPLETEQVVLTDKILQEGRQYVQANNRFNAVANTTCLLSCGTCVVISVAIILFLLIGL